MDLPAVFITRLHMHVPEDVLVMDVGCACDVLWMYVMNYVCVLCDAKCLCAVSCIIYEFCVFAFEGKQQTKK